MIRETGIDTQSAKQAVVRQTVRGTDKQHRTLSVISGDEPLRLIGARQKEEEESRVVERVSFSRDQLKKLVKDVDENGWQPPQRA